MPVLAFSTSTISPASRPKRLPISRASMPIRNPPALTRLFSAFIACAVPTPPVRVTLLPMLRSSGSARAASASVPPSMIASSPVRARGTPPLTGASTSRPPAASTSAASSRVRAGAPLLMSISSAPGRSPASTPSGPSSTAATTSLVGSMVTIRSQPCATARAVAARVAPSSAATSPVNAASASSTCSGKPLPAARAAIGRPIAPRPMKPTAAPLIRQPSALARPSPATRHAPP